MKIQCICVWVAVSLPPPPSPPPPPSNPSSLRHDNDRLQSSFFLSYWIQSKWIFICIRIVMYVMSVLWSLTFCRTLLWTSEWALAYDCVCTRARARTKHYTFNLSWNLTMRARMSANSWCHSPSFCGHLLAWHFFLFSSLLLVPLCCCYCYCWYPWLRHYLISRRTPPYPQEKQQQKTTIKLEMQTVCSFEHSPIFIIINFVVNSWFWQQLIQTD